MITITRPVTFNMSVPLEPEYPRPFEARPTINKQSVDIFLDDPVAFEKLMKRAPAKMKLTTVRLRKKDNTPRLREGNPVTSTKFVPVVKDGKMETWGRTICAVGNKHDTPVVKIIAPSMSTLNALKRAAISRGANVEGAMTMAEVCADARERYERTGMKDRYGKPMIPPSCRPEMLGTTSVRVIGKTDDVRDIVKDALAITSMTSDNVMLQRMALSEKDKEVNKVCFDVIRAYVTTVDDRHDSGRDEF